MAGTKRLYAEYYAEAEELETNVSRSTGYSDVRGQKDANPSSSIAHLSKRPRTSLNARFDRMIDQVNLTLRESTTPARRGRTRTSSAGSSSVSSGLDMPKTPVDEYERLDKSNLGKSFSILRAQGKRGSYYRAGDTIEESDDDSGIQQSRCTKEPLPSWLSRTFSQLEPRNPLRKLVSTSSRTKDDEDHTMNAPFPSMTLDALPPSDNLREQPIFAFSPMQEQVQRNTHVPDGEDIATAELYQPLVSLEPFSITAPTAFSRGLAPSYEAIDHASWHNIHRQDTQPDANIPLVPFSTPGPGSNLSLAVSNPEFISAMQLDSICPDTDEAVNARSPFSIPNPSVQINRRLSDSPEHDLPLLRSPQLDPEHPFAYTADLPPSSDASALDDFHHDPPSLSGDAQHVFASKQSSRFNPFSTPGPKFAAVHRPGVYFDSPIEDPSDSDPLDPFQGYQIEELNYKWKPFLRHGRHPEFDNTSSNRVFSDIPDVEVPRDVSTPFEGTDALSSNIGSSDMSSPSPKLAPEIELQVRVATPEVKAPVVFAPGPGIFISPLRGTASSPPESHPEQPKSQTPVPVTPVNHSNIIRASSIGRPRNRKGPYPHAPSNLKNEEDESVHISTLIRPRENPMRTRSVGLGNGWQMAGSGGCKVHNTATKLDVLSQVSTESIESWTDDAS